MIKFEKTSDGFNIFFKEYLLIQHTLKKPCVSIGNGIGVYKSKFGAFKVKENVQEKIPLTQYEITTYPDSEDLLLTLHSNILSKIFGLF